MVKRSSVWPPWAVSNHLARRPAKVAKGLGSAVDCFCWIKMIKIQQFDVEMDVGQNPGT